MRIGRVTIYSIIIIVSIIVPCWIVSGCTENAHVENVEENNLNDLFDRVRGSSYFIENKGQWRPDVLFLAETAYGHIGLCNDGFYHDLGSDETPSQVRIIFLVSNRCLIRYENPGNTKFNYFMGTDPSHWASGCLAYESIVYEDLWPGIDLLFSNRDGLIKYDLIIKPGSDPSLIRMEVQGCSSIMVQDNALFMTSTNCITISDSDLKAFYRDDLTPIKASFDLTRTSYGFNLSPYDTSRTVIIDPVVNRAMLNFSTYIGGSGDDTGSDLGRDNAGNIYICGYTFSPNFPTNNGALQTYYKGNSDCFLLKLDSTGSRLITSTYFGGSYWDYCYSMKVDGVGNCYMTGLTNSTDFPVTPGAYSIQPIQDSWDIFILKLNNTGSELLASTYFGGSDYDESSSIDIDAFGSVIVAGLTSSIDLPLTSNAFQNTLSIGPGGSVDLFIMSMDLTNMTLIYSTYLGGTGFEEVNDIVQDGCGSVFACGMTDSLDFNVTSGAYSTTPSWNDAFLLKLNLTSGSLSYSTFFGGNSGGCFAGLYIDRAGNAYGCGYTGSTNLPVTSEAFDQSFNGGWLDGFVMCLDPTGSILLYCTYIGGSGDERIEDISADERGCLHITGGTSSRNFPLTSKSFQTQFAGGDGDEFYLELSLNCSKLIYSTYIGGNAGEWNIGIEFDQLMGEPIIAMTTSSTDMSSTTGCYKSRSVGGTDLFVLKLNLTIPPSAPTVFSARAGDSFVELCWGLPLKDGGSPITGYQVLRGIKSGELNVLATTGTNLIFNDTQPSNGISYYYGIRAINRMGPGDLSQVLQSRPGATPSSPQNVKAEHGDAKVNISWSPPKECGGLVITGFRLYKSILGNDQVDTIEIKANLRSFTDVDVVNGVTYQYYMSALNDLGESSGSSKTTVTPCSKPGTITNFSARSGPGYVVLSWFPPESNGGSPILNYFLYRAQGAKSISKFKTLEASTLYWNDTGLLNGMTYWYRLVAVNSEGNSNPSEEIQGLPIDRPSPPVKFNIEAADGKAIISWDEPWDNGGAIIDGFSIYRYKDQIWFKIGQIGPDTYSYTDSSVVNGVKYSYRITAFNIIGESEPTDIIDLISMGIPSAPGGLKIVPEDGFVVLLWDIPSDDGGSPISLFIIYRGESVAMMTFYRSVNGSNMVFNDTSVKNGETYYYSITAVNFVGESSHSDIKTARPVGLPDPPSNIWIVPCDGYVDISWGQPRDDGGAGIDIIKIYRETESGSFASILTSASLQGSFRDGSVTNGVYYRYMLTSMNSVGESVPSDPVSVIPSGKPSQPKDLLAKVDDGSVQIWWVPPPNDGGTPITGYKIYRSSDQDNYRYIGEVSPGNLSFTDRYGRPGMCYWYTVSAVNVNGESQPSQASSVSINKEEDPSMVPLIIGGLSLLSFMIVGVLITLLLLRKKRMADQHRMITPSPQFPQVGLTTQLTQYPRPIYPNSIQPAPFKQTIPDQESCQYIKQPSTR